MENSKKRVVEGYIYLYPYSGDDIFVHPEKIDPRSFEELSRIHHEVWDGKGISFLKLLGDLEGKRVRVVIEDKKILIEILDE